MEQRHVLLVTFPVQGHINPSLQIATRLIKMGIHVTFVTSFSARRRLADTKGLTFLGFSDGFDDGFKLGDDANKLKESMRSNGSKALRDAIAAAAEGGRPVTCLVHTLLLPWATEVARELHVPSALLWTQLATVFSIYHHYFNGFADEITEKSDNPGWKIQIPGAPPLSKTDLPSILLPSSSELDKFSVAAFKEQFDLLDADPGKPKVLVNTFDSLEAEALASFDRYELFVVGPLIPSAFIGGEEKSFGGDLYEKSDDCIEWLNSKPQSSVVYVAFGSLLRLPKAQKEEIAAGLLRSGRPFLWVMRDSEEEGEEKLSCLEDLDKIGKIVTWCSQLEVLTHPSLGCFVTHCGWNSTLESLSCGVPVVAFPRLADQGTNAKMIEDAWRIGVRVRGNEDGIVESGEIWRCVEEVMDGGVKSVEFRNNANKWKGLAGEAAAENGSSAMNLKAFLDHTS